MNNYPIGLVSVSFRELTHRQILEAMKNTRLECIEWGSDIHAPFADTERLYEIARLQEEYGFYCSGYGTYFRLGHTDINELTQYISAAKILGTNVIRLWCGDKKSDEYTKRERQALFSECISAAEIAEKYGVTLCMECHNNTFTQTLDGALELMNEVHSESFRMYWQPNQFAAVSDNLRYAETISPYVKCVHVFNWEGNNKYPLSMAKDVWTGYISCFDAQTFMLLEFMPDGKIESLKAEADALFGVVEKY